MKTRSLGTPTLAVLGNLTIDEVVKNGKPKIAPGGSALYVSTAAALLRTRVDVVSQVGMDYPAENLAWLSKRGIGVERVRRSTEETCRFRLTYRNGSRTLQLLQRGGRLGFDQARGSWTSVHLGPVFQEVSPSIALAARKRASFLSMDLQGFLRQATESGKVTLQPSKLARVLPVVDFVKATTEEVLVQTSKSDVFSGAKKILGQGPKHLVVTMGNKGAVLAERSGETYRVPAYPEKRVSDPTGAGDALVGGWLASFQSTRDPMWAMSVGSALASMLVRRRGLAKLRVSRRELFRRSAWVYGRARRVEV